MNHTRNGRVAAMVHRHAGCWSSVFELFKAHVNTTYYVSPTRPMLCPWSSQPSAVREANYEKQVFEKSISNHNHNDKPN